jgi:purine-cytosine permease-like protein
MYVIGLGAAIFAGEGDVSAIMAKAGLGAAALTTIVFSTVTTTFLDAYSAGVSAGSISEKLREKPTAVAVCAAGTLLAIFTPPSQFEVFLYWIGSVFAPWPLSSSRSIIYATRKRRAA